LATYTPEEFVGKLAELAVAGSEVPRTGIRPAAELVATAIMAASPRRLRGVGRGGASIGARVWNVGESFGEATAEVRPFGPYHLLELPTRPHQIPRAGSVGRRYVAFGEHPGTHGKHIWEAASLAAVPAVEALFGRVNQAALEAVL
jgi:hypothetical protein